MLFLIIASIILLISIVYAIKDKFFAWVIIGSMFSGFPLVFLGAANVPKVVDDGIHTIPIVQLRQSNQYSMDGSGSFLYWSVNSKQQLQYVVMHKENGRMIRQSLNQSTTYIVETYGMPRVEYNQVLKIYPMWRTWPSNWNKQETFYQLDGATIYVPIGTVIQEFEHL